MTKTLLITYTPRHESKTAELVRTYIDEIGEKSEITHLDLVKTPAPLLLEDNLNALLKRNFMGMELSESENKDNETALLIASHDLNHFHQTLDKRLQLEDGIVSKLLQEAPEVLDAKESNRNVLNFPTKKLSNTHFTS